MEAELPSGFDLVEETVEAGEHRLSIVRPRDSHELLDEQAFEREEFLPYWAELWPSALALATTIAMRPLAGVRVLELGCGLAVPSVVAALRGARVLATDWSPDALRFAHENARRNGAALATALARWDDAAALVTRGPWELVLASDVLYERRNAERLLELLPRLVASAGRVLVADPGRPYSGSFLQRAEETWQVEPVEPFERPFVVELYRPA